MKYVFKDADSYHRIMHVTNTSVLGAQCSLPIGRWECIFKVDDDGYVYNETPITHGHVSHSVHNHATRTHK